MMNEFNLIEACFIPICVELNDVFQCKVESNKIKFNKQ